MSTEATATRRPSTAEVRRELVAIRKAKGLDVDAVSTHARKLQGLPVVSDEMEQSKFDQTDRATAAVKAVKCAVNEMAKNDKQSFEILIRTLTHRDRQQSLDAIRLSLMAGFYLSDNSRPHYDQLEASAYTRLAASLVEADVSPCRSIDVEVVASQLADVYCRREVELQEVLSEYSYSINDPILRQALRRALIERLPNGISLLRAHAVPEELLVDALFIITYEIYRGKLNDPANLLSSDYFYSEFVDHDAEKDLRPHLQRIAGISPREVHPEALAYDLARKDLDFRRTRLISILAELFELQEREHWRSIGRPN